MSIVNSITNLVDLNTTKYNKKLKAMKASTKQATKQLGQSFSSIGTAWKAALATVTAGAISGAIAKELKATEAAVASFIGTTGGVAAAREQFEMLQQAARDTIQPFEALKAVTLDLRKNGIQATAEQLKTFSQIAYGTGQSLETVGRAFTATIQGRYKALNQLGIVAKDTGNTLALTYKGVTTEIEKNSEALGKYFEKIGRENEGVLEYLQGGLTGALNHLENAWGDFYRALAESGLGQAIADTVREVAKALDGITAWINRNQNSVRQFFSSWSWYVKKLGDSFSILRQEMEDWISTSEKVKKTGAGDGDDAGILGWLTSAAETAGDKYYELFNGSAAERAYKEEKAKIVAINKDRLKQYRKGSDEYQAEVERGNQRIVDLEKKYANEQTTVIGRLGKFFDLDDTALKMHRNLERNAQELEKFKEQREEAENALKGEPTETEPLAPIEFKDTGKGAGGAGKATVDAWADVLRKLEGMQRDSYTDLERLRADYNASMQELAEAYANSQTATEEDLANARAVIDADYTRKYKALTEEAQAFLRGIRDDDSEALQVKYQEDLERLEQYHEEQLISEAEFLQARDKLRQDFDKASAKLRSEKNDFLTPEDLERMQAFQDGITSLSDAFGNLTEGMSTSSSAYRAMFAIQKAFAIASATANAIVAWSKALTEGATWYESLANYASAISITTGILGQLSSLTMHDKGGKIPAGGLGIVGEYGPELIEGPANVTSRKQTADLARQAVNGGNVTVNLYENAEKAGQVEQTDGLDGDRIINIFVSNIRKGGQIARTLESTYQVRRFGA